MHISEHRLVAHECTHLYSPNISEGFQPRWIVMHYTVVMGFEECLKWFCDPEKQVSVHFVIGRDGEIAQLVNCDQKAWHCGQSHWQDLEGINAYAIGIELVNAGKLEQKENGIESWFGTPIPPEEIIWAQHANEDHRAPWHQYTQAQIHSAQKLIQTLCQHYPIEDILGHDQIAPGRKVDPGPALDLSKFRDLLIQARDN